jgi:hypothetical protein
LISTALLIPEPRNNAMHLPLSCSAEEQTDPFKIPTKHNIRMAMYWLLQGSQPGDSLVFHYSGHGAQQRSYSGDEADGMDETFCPLDFETQGMIVDDEINTALVRPLPHGAKLHALIDACHSGTALDLPFLCRMSRFFNLVVLPCAWHDKSPVSVLQLNLLTSSP